MLLSNMFVCRCICDNNRRKCLKEKGKTMRNLSDEIQEIYEDFSKDNSNSINAVMEDCDFEFCKDEINSQLYSALDKANQVFKERIEMLSDKLNDEIEFCSSKYNDRPIETKVAIKRLCLELKGILGGSDL